MFKIIWHSLSKRWVKSLATQFMVAIGVGILFSLYLLYQGVSVGLNTGEKRLGADLIVVPSDAEGLMESEELLFTGAPACIYMDKNYEAKVAKIPGVKRVTSQFFTQTLNSSCCSTSSSTRMIGFDAGTDWVLQSWSKDLPDKYAGNDIMIGCEVQGFTGKDTYILGKHVNIVRVLEPTGTMLDQSILMNMDLARSMAKEKEEMQHFWDEYGDPDNLVTAILVDTEDDKKMEVTRSIEKELGNVKVIKSSEILKNVKGQMNTIFIILLGGGILAFLASICQLFARFFSLARDRKEEWGLYRAIGATRKDLKLLITGEALCLTLSGAIPGFGIGALLYYLFLIMLDSQKAFPFITPSALTVLIGIALVVLLYTFTAFFAAWFPARQSGRIDPSVAMAMGDID